MIALATLMFIILVGMVAAITGAVILIKIGGWLAILSATLILMYFFTSASIVIILMLAELGNRYGKTKKGE